MLIHSNSHVMNRSPNLSLTKRIALTWLISAIAAGGLCFDAHAATNPEIDMGRRTSELASFSNASSGTPLPMQPATSGDVSGKPSLRISADQNPRKAFEDSASGQKDTKPAPTENHFQATAGACPDRPAPPVPAYSAQREIVDSFTADFFEQKRVYPDVPHLDPKLVAQAMLDGGYRLSFTFVIAHRGVHSESGYTENGLSGIWRAYQAGADGVEIDIKTDCTNNYTVLGHDFAIGREQNVSTFDLNKNFPTTDPIYTDESKWPFRMNNATNDPNNPNRLTNFMADYWNKQLKDQFDTESIFKDPQITAYQAMYYVAKYTPMMIWLDVKNSSDLKASVNELRQVRLDLPGNINLTYIGLKIGAGTLRDPAIDFNPSAATNTPGLLYFAVLGLGDLDRVKADGGGDLIAGLKKYCNPDNGCIGVELAHKYAESPTSPVLSYINHTEDLSIAGFHTVPQYDWSNYVNQDVEQKGVSFVRNFNRTFPRTDGSCCFSLDDSLNIGLGQSELLDRRGSYNWNIDTFDIITSDDATNLLRSLSQKGLRPESLIQHFGGKIPPYYHPAPSTDSLYALFSQQGNCWVTAKAENQIMGCSSKFTRNSVFSLTYSKQLSSGPIWQLSTIDGSIARSSSNSVLSVPIAGLDPSAHYSLSITPSGEGVFVTRVNDFATLRDWFVDANKQLSLQTPGIVGDNFTMIPIRQAQLEKPLAPGQAENRIGPAGSVLWCDEGDTCGSTHTPQVRERVAFGVNHLWVYKMLERDTLATLKCSVETFGSDPAPGQTKACYRLPFFEGPIAADYETIVPEGARLPVDVYAISYGAKMPDLTTWQGNFGVPEQLADQTVCHNFVGAPDPAQNYTKSCKVLQGFSDVSKFAPCGDSRVVNGCVFGTPHSVALLYFGSDQQQRFTYKTFTNGVRCSADEFGVQSFGYYVECFARVVSDTDPKVDNYTWCAALGETCAISVDGHGPSSDRFLAAYADDKGRVYYAQLQGNFICNLETFGQTGKPSKAACFYRLY